MYPQSFADLWAIQLLPFLAQAYFNGEPQWSLEQIPDQSGKVAIITGGNAGLGKETAKALLQHNSKVYLACRSKTNAEAVIRELREATGKEAIFLPLDLADLKSVRAAAEEFMSQEKELHALYNNAGLMFCPFELEANGYDMQIHVNVLGHFYFTKLLLPVLLSPAESNSGEKARVINVSSSAHYLSRSVALDFNTFRCGPARNKRNTEGMYIQSKFAAIVFSNELDRRYGHQGLISISVNPGNIKTDLNRHVKSLFKRLVLTCLQVHPTTKGALSHLYAGTALAASELGGKFLIPWARVGSPRLNTQDPRLGADLWEWLEEQVHDV